MDQDKEMKRMEEIQDCLDLLELRSNQYDEWEAEERHQELCDLLENEKPNTQHYREFHVTRWNNWN